MLNKIDHILNNFNFEIVHTVMSLPIHPEYDDDGNVIKKTPWRVLISPQEFRVPTIYELKELARKLLMELALHPEEEYAMHTGPYKVSKLGTSLRLEFVCETYEYD